MHGPDLGINLSDPRETATVAYLDVADRSTLGAVITKVSEQETVRHSRTGELIEETKVRAIFEVAVRNDFSSDETVEKTRRC